MDLHLRKFWENLGDPEIHFGSGLVVGLALETWALLAVAASLPLGGVAGFVEDVFLFVVPLVVAIYHMATDRLVLKWGPSHGMACMRPFIDVRRVGNDVVMDWRKKD